MKYLYAFLLVFAFSALNAQQTVKLEEVSTHIGDTVTLKAKIFGIRQLTNAKGAPTFINLGAAYPNQLLTVVIWQDVKDKMGFDALEEKYIGGMAVVTGKLELYNGKPQIVIRDPKQFDILYDEEVKLSELPR